MSHQGSLLVARPGLTGMFKNSVVYVCQDSPLGATGIILNKPSEYALDDVVVNGYVDLYRDEILNYGGPLKPKALMMLHSQEWFSETTISVGELQMSSDRMMLDKISEGNVPVYWRLFMGMCSWQPGQLEVELTQPMLPNGSPAWLVCPFDPLVVFGYDGDHQWDVAVEHCSKMAFSEFF